MPTNNEVIYAAHVENLKYIQYSIDEIFTLAKLKIKCKQENTDNFKSIIRLLILQLGIWSEARYNKLICEYKYNSSTKDKIFTELELNLLNLNKEKIKQWNTIVELSFRKHYNIYIGYELSAVNLGQDKFDKYINIVDIIKIHLQSIIEIRNKLAHGHWIKQLTPNAQQINNINISHIAAGMVLGNSKNKNAARKRVYCKILMRPFLPSDTLPIQGARHGSQLQRSACKIPAIDAPPIDNCRLKIESKSCI